MALNLFIILPCDLLAAEVGLQLRAYLTHVHSIENPDIYINFSFTKYLKPFRVSGEYRVPHNVQPLFIMLAVHVGLWSCFKCQTLSHESPAFIPNGQ